MLKSRVGTPRSNDKNFIVVVFVSFFLVIFKILYPLSFAEMFFLHVGIDLREICLPHQLGINSKA